MRWHCPPDTGFEIRALAVWGRARYLSVTEAPHNTDFHTWMGKKHFCFFQTAETGNRTANSGAERSGANHYPRAPALLSRGSFEQSDRYQRLREYWADFGCEKTAGRDLPFCGSPASAVLKSSCGNRNDLRETRHSCEGRPHMSCTHQKLTCTSNVLVWSATGQSLVNQISQWHGGITQKNNNFAYQEYVTDLTHRYWCPVRMLFLISRSHR